MCLWYRDAFLYGLGDVLVVTGAGVCRMLPEEGDGECCPGGLGVCLVVVGLGLSPNDHSDWSIWHICEEAHRDMHFHSFRAVLVDLVGRRGRDDGYQGFATVGCGVYRCCDRTSVDAVLVTVLSGDLRCRAFGDERLDVVREVVDHAGEILDGGAEE